MRYISAKKLGFNKTQTITLSEFAGRIHPETRRHEFLKHPDVLNITWYHYFLYEQQYETVRTDNQEEGEQKMYLISCDAHFLDTFEMEFAAGRNFSDDRPTDAQDAVILNETAVKKLGWIDPIGKVLHWQFRPNMRVIGVVKDFHTNSLHEQIKPVFIIKDYKLKYHTVKVRTENLPDVLAFLQEKWDALLPGVPFEFTFVNDDLAQLYENEKQLGQLSGIFSLIAIFVSCLGVFGLATFTAEQRTKEIGIRKVLGATVWNITLNLSRNMIYLVALANLLAWPIAYWMMKNWLQQFAYRIDLWIGLFFISGGIAFAIALLTVAYRSFKAASANPIDSLRYE
jgi:putative ABC transport system permease protein